MVDTWLLILEITALLVCVFVLIGAFGSFVGHLFKHGLIGCTCYKGGWDPWCQVHGKQARANAEDTSADGERGF